jgi:hypothetical protein
MKIKIDAHVIATEAIVSIKRDFHTRFTITMLGPSSIQIERETHVSYPTHDEPRYISPYDSGFNNLLPEFQEKFKEMSDNHSKLRQEAYQKDRESIDKMYDQLMTLWETEKMGEIKDITV